MTLFAWLVFVYLAVDLGTEFGIPVRLSQVIRGVLLLLMLLAFLGVFGRYGDARAESRVAEVSAESSPDLAASRP